MRYTILMAIRHLASNRLFALVNIVGSTLSLLAFYLLVSYVFNELSFDKMYTDYARVCRVNVTFKDPDSEFHWPATPPALAEHLHNTVPGIDRVARLYQADFPHRFTHGDVGYIETKVLYADSLFLEILDYPLVAGNRRTALDHPNSIVLTRDAAEKYFGSTDPLGRQLILNNTRTLTVTGVLENIPSTSHLDFAYLASFTTFEVPRGYTDDLTSWEWTSFVTYVALSPSVNPTSLEADIKNIWKSNTRFSTGEDIDIHLQPVSEIYLNSSNYNHPYLSGNFRQGNINTLLGLGAAAVVILMIALFNFTNLAVATIIRRAKSVSMRKIIGSGNGRIISQFFVEASLIQLVSGCVVLVSLSIFRSPFDNLMGFPVLPFSSIGARSFSVLLMAMAVISVLAIIYPALVIKRMKVLTVLKEGLAARRNGFSVQQLLIIAQICITAVLLSMTLVVRKQLQFVSDKDLGYQSENVMIVRMLGEDMALHYDKIKNSMMQLPEVVGVSRAKHSFDGKSGGSPIKQTTRPDTEFKATAFYESHHDFLKTMGIRLLSGRDFSPDFKADSSESIIVNQAALSAIGLNLENALGTEVSFLNRTFTIIGVTENFNYSSLHNAVGPMVMVMPFTNSTKLFLKLAAGDAREQVKSLKAAWNAIVPDVPFDFTFLDSQVDLMYKSDERFSRLVNVFTLIGIVTACIGLVAIAWFSMTLRLKEVAIRKVLGAEMRRLVILLAGQYSVYVIIALCISIPASIYASNMWLSAFAYRINSTIDAISGAITLLILILVGILCSVAGRLAIVNPVKNLRNE